MTSKKNQLIRKLQGGLTDKEYLDADDHTCPHCGRNDYDGYIQCVGYWDRDTSRGWSESIFKYRCKDSIWTDSPNGCNRVWYEETMRSETKLHLKMPKSWRGVPKA